jgi:hypothetical protein
VTSFLLGLALAAAIRPHVAGVLVVSTAIAHWVSPGSRHKTLHWIHGFGILILSVLVVNYGFVNLGLEDIDVENFREYVQVISVRSSQGDSQISAPGVTLVGIPFAFINTLFRPFPWEVSHPLMAAACLELIVLWYLAIKRRRRIVELALQWRSNRLLRLSLPLIIFYTLMLGMAVGNLGIIARQRIHILPMLFIWLEALPQTNPIQKRSSIPKRFVWNRPVPLPPTLRAEGEKR